jgi:hypothetical protein
MTHHFDNFGWYTSAQLEGRATSVAPTNFSETTTPGQPRANFTGYVWQDLSYVAPPEPVPVMPTVAEYTAAIQAMLDTEARTHNYDSILSLASYVASTHPPFAAEGQAGLDWRDAVWGTSYSLMAQVHAGTLAQPTIAELLAMLPPMVWPV